MNNKSFGKLIKELRLKNSLSQSQLAEMVECSEKEIRRIEQDKNTPSIYLLHQLSKVFNMDLNEYYKLAYQYRSFEAYDKFNKLNCAIQKSDINLIDDLISEYENTLDFAEGENLQLIYYGRALCLTIRDEDYNSSIQYCLSGIQVNYPTFSLSTLKLHAYSNTSYAIINTLGCNYLYLNQLPIAKELFLYLCDNIESYILNPTYSLFQSTEFHKKIYQLSLYNISNLCNDMQEYTNALHYAEKGIHFSLESNNIRFLADLFFIKFRSLYHLEQYDGLQKTYKHTIALYEITGQYEKANKLREYLHTEFHKLISKGCQ